MLQQYYGDTILKDSESKKLLSMRKLIRSN